MFEGLEVVPGGELRALGKVLRESNEFAWDPLRLGFVDEHGGIELGDVLRERLHQHRGVRLPVFAVPPLRSGEPLVSKPFKD